MLIEWYREYLFPKKGSDGRDHSRWMQPRKPWLQLGLQGWVGFRLNGKETERMGLLGSGQYHVQRKKRAQGHS